MSSAHDPFYIVKEEIQESIDKLQETFRQWENTPSNTGDQVHLTKELSAGCESIKWQVDELDKAIGVAARDPSWYGIDEIELEKRRRWTNSARNQVGMVKKAVQAGKVLSNTVGASLNGMRTELMRLPNDHPYQAGKSSNFVAQDNDDFISSESDRQLLLIKQQDEELDELSASVERIGGVGLTIHEELVGQVRILDELSLEMDSTANRLDFIQLLASEVAHDVFRNEMNFGHPCFKTSTKKESGVVSEILQDWCCKHPVLSYKNFTVFPFGIPNEQAFPLKKVAMVMKKASSKGQIMMIVGLIILFIVLFVLVFFT